MSLLCNCDTLLECLRLLSTHSPSSNWNIKIRHTLVLGGLDHYYCYYYYYYELLRLYGHWTALVLASHIQKIVLLNVAIETLFSDNSGRGNEYLL